MIKAIIGDMIILVNAEEGYGWSISDDYEILTISNFDVIKRYDWNEEYGEDIKKVIIEEGVTQIPAMAFRNCINLESITIPSTVTDIGSAFNEGFSIKEVYISDLSAWCSIDFTKTISNPLYYGAKLYINGSLSKNLVIPDGVGSIKDFVFYNYSYLKTITIPKSVTSIGNKAFQNCSNLADVYYSGTEADWKVLSIGINNNEFKNAKISLANGILVYPVNVESGNYILVGCYKGDRIVYIDFKKYNNEEYIIFNTDVDYDSSKIFKWRDLNSIVPLGI